MRLSAPAFSPLHMPLSKTQAVLVCPGLEAQFEAYCSPLHAQRRYIFTSSEGPHLLSQHSCLLPYSDVREEGAPCGELRSAGILKRQSRGACWAGLGAGAPGQWTAAALCSAANSSCSVSQAPAAGPEQAPLLCCTGRRQLLVSGQLTGQRCFTCCCITSPT